MTPSRLRDREHGGDRPTRPPRINPALSQKFARPYPLGRRLAVVDAQAKKGCCKLPAAAVARTASALAREFVAQIPYPATITPISSFSSNSFRVFNLLAPCGMGRRGVASRSPVGSPVGRPWVEGASWPRRRCSGLGTALRAAAPIGRSGAALTSPLRRRTGLPCLRRDRAFRAPADCGADKGWNCGCSRAGQASRAPTPRRRQNRGRAQPGESGPVADRRR